MNATITIWIINAHTKVSNSVVFVDDVSFLGWSDGQSEDPPWRLLKKRLRAPALFRDRVERCWKWIVFHQSFFLADGFSSIHTKTWPTLISEGFSWCEWLQPARGQTAQERPRRLWARHDLHFANQKVKRETEWNRMEKCRNHLKPLENCLRRWSCSCRGSPGA